MKLPLTRWDDGMLDPAVPDVVREHQDDVPVHLDADAAADPDEGLIEDVPA